MKKHLLLLAGSAVLFASCGSNNNQAQTQAQIDSAVNAKMAQHDAENAAKNDSTLKAMEKEKAEAMAREHHGEKKHESKKEEPAAPVTPPPPPPPPATGMRSHSDQSKTNPSTGTDQKPAGGGMRAHSDQSTGK